MIRRIVRDHRTRGRDAVTTITGWPSVRAGEEKYIFPFNEEADVFFNSQCLYELSALKHYAEPLLEQIPQESPAYPEAQRMLAFLQCFVEMTDDSIIPNQSIVREFIGGSVLMNEE
jgi:uridine kinase